MKTIKTRDNAHHCPVLNLCTRDIMRMQVKCVSSTKGGKDYHNKCLKVFLMKTFSISIIIRESNEPFFPHNLAFSKPS